MKPLPMVTLNEDLLSFTPVTCLANMSGTDIRPLPVQEALVIE
jgi:hypothetical protein